MKDEENNEKGNSSDEDSVFGSFNPNLKTKGTS